MATHAQIFAAALIMISSSVVAVPNPRNKDIDMAIEEMESANYFTFVMLMNMVPPNLFQGNVTFLMPNDKSLSRSMILQNNVDDLLLRHSIPSPLLLEHLIHLPTNSILPTSNPDLMLRLSNNGRRGLFLGNVRIVSPNICTHGSSVRCHGIDGVVSVDILTPGVHSPITCPEIPIPTAAPSLAPPTVAPAYGPTSNETSNGDRQQMKLSFACLVFVWVVHSKLVSLV